MVDAGENALLIENEAEMLAFAADMAETLSPIDTVCLYGNLGAGKTTLARALIRTITGVPELEVPSPTFTLVQSYEGSESIIHHFDLYRLADPDELTELGFSEMTGSGLCLIEWPERAGPYLPAQRIDLYLNIDPADDKRRLITLKRRHG